MTPTELVTGPNTLTDAIYEASLNPACRALRDEYYAIWFKGLPSYDAARAATLLANAQATGAPIDYCLMLLRWPALITMQVREANGYVNGIPPYGSTNVNVAPGDPAPNGIIANYPSTMPAGWIKTSTDAKDYPAYVAPAGPVVPIVYGVLTNEFLISSETTVDPNTGIPSTINKYYFAPQYGQQVIIGLNIVFQGMKYVGAYYPGGEQGPVGTASAMKMWLLQGPAAA